MDADNRLFLVNFGEKGTNPKENCFQCGISEFNIGLRYTEKDIQEINYLDVGQVWHDPGSDLRFLPRKKASTIRVKRLK